MRPKWVPGGLRGGPWRLPGGSLEAFGRPWGAEGDFERFWVPLGRPFGTPKRLKIDAKIEPEIEQRFGASFWSSGVHFGIDFGVILGSFWGLFCCPPAKHENLDFR